MSEHTYDGFRFEFRHADIGAPKWRQVRQIIAVAETVTAALASINEIVGTANEAKLVASGPAVLEEARRRGIGDGFAVVLDPAHLA